MTQETKASRIFKSLCSFFFKNQDQKCLKGKHLWRLLYFKKGKREKQGFRFSHGNMRCTNCFLFKRESFLVGEGDYEFLHKADVFKVNYFGICNNWKDVQTLFKHSKKKAPSNEPNVLFCCVERSADLTCLFLVFKDGQGIYTVEDVWDESETPRWIVKEFDGEAIRKSIDKDGRLMCQVFAYHQYDVNSKVESTLISLPILDFNLRCEAIMSLETMLSYTGHPRERTGAICANNMKTLKKVKEQYPDLVVRGGTANILLEADCETIRQIERKYPNFIIMSYYDALRFVEP